MRNAFASALIQAAQTDPRVLLLTGDHGYALFDEFRRVCPDQYLNAGVAEQNMVGVAAGLAKGGLRPVVYGLSAFVPIRVLEQIKRPRVVACDSMNFWIKGRLDAVKRTIEHVDILIINDAETRMLADEPNLVRAANKVLAMGPQTLIVKRGEYGVLMFNGKSIFGAPAFPLEDVFDPTGAGDSFAGGFMGALAHAGDVNERVFRRGIVFGSVMASFNVEQFSLNRLTNLTRAEVDERFRQFKALTHFEEL